MGSDHYFSASPASAQKLRTSRVTLAGADVDVTVAGGVFSPDRIDTGTRVLLRNTPAAPASGDVLDLGCGWGPIALSCALQSPRATVWAVDVNERARDLVRRNAAALGLANVRVAAPDDVPDDMRLRSIRSNPPIRVGKAVLHDMLLRWIGRLEPGGDGWFVVQRNLGSDSLQRWLAETLDDAFAVDRPATGSGFRVLRVRRAGAPPAAATPATPG